MIHDGNSYPMIFSRLVANEATTALQAPMNRQTAMPLTPSFWS
jgi:hypothetical protein